MAFRPLISRPNFRALAVASVCFLAAYPLAAWVLPKIGPTIALLIFVLLLVGTGIVAGYLAGRSPLMHGIILGAFIGVLAIVSLSVLGGLGIGDIASILKSGLPALISMAIPGITLCTLGAILGDYIQGRRAP